MLRAVWNPFLGVSGPADRAARTVEPRHELIRAAEKRRGFLALQEQSV